MSEIVRSPGLKAGWSYLANSMNPDMSIAGEKIVNSCEWPGVWFPFLTRNVL